MDPQYIHALMHGEIDLKKKDPKKEKTAPKTEAESELDRQIDAYVDALELDEDPSHNALQNVKARKEAMKMEIKEAAKLPALSQQAQTAITLLLSEGPAYLSHEANETLQSDFSNASANLASPSEKSEESLQTLAKISDATMTSIIEVAIAKFTEARFEDSLSLFSLLTILNPAYSEYWLRMGVAAQKCDKIDLASRAYAAAIELDPNLIGARLFAAECFVNRGLMNEAKEQVEAAKKIVENNKVDQMWLDLLPKIESMAKG
jgi:tetratricopeptide (TPR) repeat protein